jgi:uncharacterized protein DUF3152
VEARRLARERMLRRRRRAFLAVTLLVAVALIAVDMLHGGTSDPKPHAAAAAVPTHSVAPTSGRPSSGPTAQAVTYPKDGSGRFTTATGSSTVYGTAGTLLRFQVKVEKDIHGLDVQRFAATVTSILDNPQGWTAGGLWRFQRVGPGQPHDFVLHLVTPGTRDTMCHDTPPPDGYTSCRYRNNVMINVSRWMHGVPYYKNLAVYREYSISHEVGHRLGQVHELCPGKGQKAPVMQQQTLGLHGCVPNPWPYPDGKFYAGQAGEYPQNNIPTDPPSYYTN